VAHVFDDADGAGEVDFARVEAGAGLVRRQHRDDPPAQYRYCVILEHGAGRPVIAGLEVMIGHGGRLGGSRRLWIAGECHAVLLFRRRK
jgi:hypothetical protein